MVQDTFVSRIELNGWGCWRKIRDTGIFLDEAKQVMSDTKTRSKPDDLNMFDWYFLWFKDGVTPMVRTRA